MTSSGMLIVDMSAVKLPGEVKQNLPPECGQLIDMGGYGVIVSVNVNK
jgi:hypothetical protein